MLRTALAVLLVMAGLGMHGAQRTTGRTPGSTAHFVQATVYSGGMRVTLTTPATGSAAHHVILKLGGDTRAISNRPVFFTVSRLLRSPGKAQPMRHSGGSYGADVRIPQDGIWEVLVQLHDVRGGVHLVPFLLRIVSRPSTRNWSLFPIFVPVNSWNPAISFPLGPYIADLSATIAPFGKATFRIHLGPQARLPARLRLDLTMLDMAMGHTYSTALPVHHGVYRAQGFFSMPGAWSVSIAAGRQSSSAALVVGERAQKAKGHL